MKRDYPAAVLVHREGCPEAPSGLIPMATADIARAYPNGRMHHCYHFSLFPKGLVETMAYPPHAYEESSVTYPDATRPMCSVCMGTHGTLDALILPPGVR